ncbi:MAG: tRNA uracil 4-sulfurtransferase ThiI [Longibaculum muris]|uniref:Probable tRNA sulfurtransferase n=1 Tax=Longibaculum muris TaxID=1796628 RepID=A0A4V2W4S5_9FIRM|nr:tRNA uracil 4-sulfurtransferase ThiI [Longibaculum muris]KXU47941.1 thiamine biosynthesis/tRNA modification protein ThiI [Candidatus Stoquefichus sp. KLE1796]MBS5368523.1 tRNA 4-thiouridine(8) synthase ThiI [Coprobacillus cateniformis]MCR1888700.1 tRNA 4-thiouridine(8) synthase ThiI [Longibaculum muris]MED9812721.1 tRNA uracil 4-sulfurtransferase ThiI [Longibaculum muris]TCV96959.1 thiamine biosynthesis protein ThiI [Longibaculum muris]
MECNHILVRFGELTTKGKNRKMFIRKLCQNTKEILKPMSQLKYELSFDRMYIILNGEDPKAVAEKLKTVFGIHSFSFCYKVESDLEKIKEVCLQVVENNPGQTFKIDTKRNDKDYPLHSHDINTAIAGYIFHHTSKTLKVDVHHPEILVKVELRKDYTYVMDNVIMGAGGYPVGVGGKALLMLSGGIDSPVAGYLTLKRGVDIECIHYASPPYTSDLAREKVLDLVDVLRQYTHGKIVVHIVPFTDLQLAVYEHCEESYAMTVMRRMMYRIAQGVAQKNNCLAIVNGESIGQVASQTLESMATINEVIHMPVLRPVACMDKLEIIDIATKIGTYDISIRPHEDCCTIFTPKQPATKPKSYKAQAFEANWDFETMVQECVENTQDIVIDDSYKNIENLF